MKIYCSGPIAGYLQRNEPDFRATEQALTLLGHDAVVPLDIAPFTHVPPCPVGYASAGGHSSACYLRSDLVVLLMCEAIYMMAGWQQSRGASLEHRVAVECGLRVFYWNGKDMIGKNGDDHGH